MEVAPVGPTDKCCFFAGSSASSSCASKGCFLSRSVGEGRDMLCGVWGRY